MPGHLGFTGGQTLGVEGAKVALLSYLFVCPGSREDDF